MEKSQPHIGIVIASAIAAIVLQLIMAPAITLFGVVPNFMMVAAIIMAMRNSPMRSTVIGFLLGLVFDFCSLGPIGVMTLVLTIISYAVSSLSKGSFAGGIIVDMIILVAAIALGELLVSVIYAVVGANPQFLLSLVQRVIPAIVYDTVMGCILLLIYNAVQGGRTTSPGSGLGSGRSLSRKLYK